MGNELGRHVVVVGKQNTQFQFENLKGIICVGEADILYVRMMIKQILK
jgi:hypothetical protein